MKHNFLSGQDNDLAIAFNGQAVRACWILLNPSPNVLKAF